MRRSGVILGLLAVLAPVAYAQDESKFHAEFRMEGERLKESCSGFTFGGIGGCAKTLFTDHPLHIAAGSIAPQNGFGFGGAFVYATNLKPNAQGNAWRLRWNADAVGSPNGSWRAGLYLKAFPTPSTPTAKVQPLISAYVQAISLSKLGFFGLGTATAEAGRSFFGMQETIAGASGLMPVWKFALYGEINGRFVDIRGRHGDASPSIEQLYTEADAPGLTRQPAFLQLGEGVRFRDSYAADHIKLNYFAVFQQFIAPGDSNSSFRRLTLDLDHEFPIYSRSSSPRPSDYVGPDGSEQNSTAPTFPRNRTGSFGFRALITESIAPAGHLVPFYFQPTLGGSDINGNRVLASYQDYRFRAPNFILLRASFEHTIWGPFGGTAMMDYGKAALTRGDVDLDHLRHSFAAGLTLRAGNFPQVWLLFAWGGGEGTHTIAYMNSALLGGSARPSLF